MPSRKNERHLSNLKTRRPGTSVRIQTTTTTSPVSKGKLRVDEQGEQMLKYRCGICMEVIQDSEPSKESLLCEGPCKKCFFFCFFCFFLASYNRTPSGKKMVTGVQVISASQVQSIGCRRQTLFVLPITEHTLPGGEQGH